jgi:hypothetical protein
MIHKEIKLIGQYIDYDTSNKDWWSEYQKGEALELQIKKKNALPLKEVYEKMYKDGIYYLSLHFEGGHDEGGFEGDFKFLDENKKDMHIKDVSKYTPDGWITTYHPLSYTTKIKDQNIIQVFELPETDHSNFKIDKNWLEQKWYDFGFLEEWGSFAFEGHVYGDVVVSTKNGSYNLEANETQESYEDKSFSGYMFEE